MKNPFACLFCFLLLLAACTKEDLTPGIGEASITAGIGSNSLTFDPATHGPGGTAAEIEARLEADYAAEMAEVAALAKGHRITVPAGSVDALAAAIAAVDKNGFVRLEAGDYTETGTLTISKPVTIIGEPGTRILFTGVQPTPPVVPFAPAIHFFNAGKARLVDVELVPADGPGGTALLVQNSPGTLITKVVAKNWQIGVLAEKSAGLYISRSTFVGSSQWQTDPTFSCFGIVNVNGERVRIHRNQISNAVFGVWACDEGGQMFRNELTGNYNGLVLCTVPPNSFPLPDGQVIGSAVSATRWGVGFNSAAGNFNNGYEIIDGANHCALWSNTAEGNGTQDYEFAGQTERYGFVAPTSSDNWAIIAAGDTWKDCGVDNRIRGGEAISTEESPCF